MLKENKINTIALIAHDGKKAEMVTFVRDHVEELKKFKLVATGTTGQHVQSAGLEVDAKLSGPLGGDVQIANMILEGKVQAVIFFLDPKEKQAHDPDIQTLLRICNLCDVPLASNKASGRFLLKGIISEEGKVG